MAKKVMGTIKLQIPAGAANPAPPVGPALGAQGVNIMMFCKEFNAATQSLEQGSPIPVVITAYFGEKFSKRLNAHSADASACLPPEEISNVRAEREQGTAQGRENNGGDA